MSEHYVVMVGKDLFDLHRLVNAQMEILADHSGCRWQPIGGVAVVPSEDTADLVEDGIFETGMVCRSAPNKFAQAMVLK